MYDNIGSNMQISVVQIFEVLIILAAFIFVVYEAIKALIQFDKKDKEKK